MILATRHTGLVVEDLEQSLKFYRDLLGMNVWRRMIEEGPYIDNVLGLSQARVEWVKLEVPDGTLLELLQYHSHQDCKKFANYLSNRHGCSHVAFTVDNLDNLYQLLCDHKIHCNSLPQISPDGKVKLLYCHDPDGIILELVEVL